MSNVPPLDERIQQTRAAYGEACALLGYATPNREAAEVIDHLGLTEDGQRGGRLAPFYPVSITATVDCAAQLARRYPEALLDETHAALLDLLVATVRR